MTTETTMPPETSAETRGGPAGGPGAQLRQARLDLKLAPEDVASILHLSPRQIVALEGDDYASLPGPTYVRGYLRGYAQLLGLSAEPIVETYNRSVAARKPVDLGKLAPKPEIRSDHQLVKFATIGVVALVLGLSAVWWQEQEEPAEPVAPVDEAPAEQVEAPAPTVTPADDAATSAAPPPAPVEKLPAKAPPAKPVAVPPVAPARPAIPVAPVTTAAPTSEVAADVPPAQAGTAGPRGHLIMQATLDSWADVRDANGIRLLYEIIPAGRTVAIEGVLPFSVFLGNAEGVRVQFNGETYDTTRHRRGDIARFTLGEDVKAQ